MRNLPWIAIALVMGCGNPGAGDDGAGDDDGGGPSDGRPAIDAEGGGDGGPTTDLDVNKSGTRIKMRVGTTPDGARTFLGWRDVQRNDDCYFQYAADGMQRCLPSNAASISSFFRDAGCTLPLGLVASAACPTPPVPKYATRFDTVCSAPGRYGLHVYNVTGAHTGTIFTGSPSSCTATTVQGYLFYVVGAEVPAADFAGVTESIE